ncbi:MULTISPECIES: hypothetical protein [unclassified Streptomyces]|uniref:hypothetical protein n=1 Tax=unclassified Streptomyces TaxID=2593676 RepID=UPI0036FC2577
MNKTKKRGIAALVVLVIAAAWAGISYATNTPPFKKPKGTIAAADLCPSFGDSQEAADILNRLLPYATSYRIPWEDHRYRGSGETDVDHRSSCSVSGDGTRLLLVRTELAGWGDEEAWRKEVLDSTNGRKPQPFEAGRWAFTTTPDILRVAAVNSACVPYRDAALSTSVELGSPAPADRLDDLRRLAEIAAEQAHEDARCTIPADTPARG